MAVLPSFPAVVLAVAAGYVLYLVKVLHALHAPPEAEANPSASALENVLKTDDRLKLEVYVTATERKPTKDDGPAYVQRNIGYGNAGEVKTVLAVPDDVDAKSRHHVHAFVTKDADGASPFTLHAAAPLLKRLPPKDAVKKRRLVHAPAAVRLANRIGLVADDDVDDTTDAARARDLRRTSATYNAVPEVRFRMVHDQTRFATSKGIPSDIHRRLQFFRTATPPHHAFVYPVTYDAFWLRRKLLEGREVPDGTFATAHGVSVPANVTVSFDFINLGLWRVYAALEDGLANLENVMGGGEKESDEVRQIFAETPPLLLLCTVIVSVLHLAFDILAVKNDVAYWSNREDVVGLSSRAVAFNVFASAVTLFYLHDNGASKFAIVGVVMTLGVDVWKLLKWLRMHAGGGAAGAAPSASKASGGGGGGHDDVKARMQRVTVEADRLAGAQVASALLGAVFAYAMYSLLVDRHKGWLSWVVTSLYGVAAALGFAAMTPQLFINYKLKSVEHMPWRTLIYRAINTFVDDLFSLIVDMPLGHRLSCLRDDIIFFVFLYQRHLYPPDKVNRAVPDVLTGETAKEKGELKKDR